MAKGSDRVSLIGRAVFGALALCIAALGGVLTWMIGNPLWFWIWIAVVAYMIVVLVAVARRKPTNPWADNRAAITGLPWKMRERLRKRWDDEHRDDQ
jgi:hypothetical protein